MSLGTHLCFIFYYLVFDVADFCIYVDWKMSHNCKRQKMLILLPDVVLTCADYYNLQFRFFKSLKFDYSSLLLPSSLNLKILFRCTLLIWFYGCSLIGLLLPDLKIEKADCPIDERVYW